MLQFLKRLKRLELIGIGLLVTTLLFAFVGFVLDIVLLVNQHQQHQSHPDPNPDHPCTPPPNPNNGRTTNQSAGFKEAAKLLLSGLDFSVDPCQDFYAFACNKYIHDNPLAPGQRRLATYDQSQWLVNDAVRKGIEEMGDADDIGQKLSTTEKIVRKVYQTCMSESSMPQPKDHSKEINTKLLAPFGGMPAILGTDWKPQGGWKEFWKALGQLEANFQVPHLLQSVVSVDYEEHGRHALYIDQPMLNLPREYFVKPEFLNHLETYRTGLISMVKSFAKKIGIQTPEEQIVTAVTEALRFEVELAMAAYSNELSRNYRLQYNQFTLSRLAKAYPSIEWAAYFEGLGLDVQESTSLVVVRPRFFAFIDTVLQSEDVLWSQATLVNLVGLRSLLAFSEFMGPDGEEAEAAKQKLFAIPQLETHTATGAGQRRMFSRKVGKNARAGFLRRNNNREKSSNGQKGAAADQLAQSCVDLLVGTMPFGAGYVYAKGIRERDAVRADVRMQTQLVLESFGEMLDSLEWIESHSKERARNKSANLVQNYGWPEEMYADFENHTNLDAHHAAYDGILASSTSLDLFSTVVSLIKANQWTENFGMLSQPPDRAYFGGSPALVNAWYQPERNSITFPYAAFNPPYYQLDFPQAYNYGGQAGTAGHELSHGFDDEGVQFGPEGELSDCSWNNCGWMDATSTMGFTKMAQCVVQQYSLQCCPLKSGNVRCANGATTQGENIADLAGQQAAYFAYRKYIQRFRGGEEEDALPDLEQFTPNQVFWISYAYSWCVNWDNQHLANRLLTDPHAPGSCRVNQVVQDIPEFGRDFNCRIGSSMRPNSQDRCKVWTGN